MAHEGRSAIPSGAQAARLESIMSTRSHSAAWETNLAKKVHEQTPPNKLSRLASSTATADPRASLTAPCNQ